MKVRIKTGYALYELRKLTPNAFKSKIFPLESVQGKEVKTLTPKQLLQRLPIAISQVKADNTSENLLNEIIQTIFSLHRAKEITKKVYNNILS